MKFNPDGKAGKVLGKALSVVIVAGAITLGLVVLYLANRYPRTDDSEIVANFIGIAPQVEGPILHLNVHDNQFVKPGELLFEIDDRPYRYALERALSEQASLEGQIVDETRRIAALVSAVSVSQANIQGTEADVNRSKATIDQAQADVANAGQGVSRARAEWAYANSNLHRIEPLLAKQFVTADQVDRARTFEIAQAQALKQAESQLRLAQAGLQSAIAQRDRSLAMVEQSKAQHQQTQHAVTTLEPLVTQRGAKAAAVKNARYNLDNCRVYSPFEARVTNLTISEGAYAHIGQQIFILIDARKWWAVANFREGQLQHISPGNARRRVRHVQTECALFRRSGQHRLRSHSGCGRDWPPGTRSAGCTENSELGASGRPVPGTRPCGESSPRPVSSERIRRRGDTRALRWPPLLKACRSRPRVALVLGIPQRGACPLPGPLQHGRANGDCRDPGHDRLHDFSDSLWISRRDLCIVRFS